MRALRGIGSILAVAFFVAMVPACAGAATVVNGDFESGTLAGWHVHRETGAGNWFAYKGTDAPIGRKRKPVPADPVQAPPQGVYAAIADEANPDTLILYQDLTLEAGRSQRLSLLAYYNSYKPIAVPTPNTLSVDEEILGKQKNQQFRIDVMKPAAPLDSVDPGDLLRTIFETEPGDPQEMAPTRLTADLSAFAGQTVRLRIANAVHEEVFNAGVDDISIFNAAAGQFPSRGSQNGPSLFSFGRVTANRRTGIVVLRVRVSGSGLLRVRGTPSAGGAALASGTRRLRKPIEPVTVPVVTAKTVAIHLRPTSRARAVLRRQHRLRVKLAVTFMPTGGSPETATLPVLFRLMAISSK
jgi:hypothetical protein